MEVTRSEAVLVTGASTGIGRRLTEYLAAQGHFVYAGARKQYDLAALDDIENVQALRLDVTSAADIAAAVEVVSNAGRGLYGLVNNAGVLTLGPVVGGNATELDLVMAVNALGPYRITSAFAPLVVKARGRIVMIGSVAGILADENVSIYSMSKHALEALTDSLALEMGRVGVQVSVVEASSVSTEISRNVFKRIGADPLVPDFSQYGEPDDIVAAAAHALFGPSPKRRYLIVTSEALARRTIAKQIAQLVQLNEDNPHTYGREALIGLLDEALSHSRSGQG